MTSSAHHETTSRAVEPRAPKPNGRGTSRMRTEPWALVYEGYEPDEQGLREALCVLGNGYFATRGAAPDVRAGGPHYPGTYLAGGYDRAQTEIEGREVENEDLVNLPNWLPLTFRAEGEHDWTSLETAEVLDYVQALDLRGGVLSRRLRLRDAAGRTTRWTERRLVSMAEPHLAIRAHDAPRRPSNGSGIPFRGASSWRRVRRHGSTLRAQSARARAWAGLGPIPGSDIRDRPGSAREDRSSSAVEAERNRESRASGPGVRRQDHLVTLRA